MLSMIRAQLYRLVKTRLFIVLSIVVAAWAAVQAFSLWTAAQPEYGMTSLIEGDLSQTSILAVYGTGFVSGSPLAAGACLLAADFLAMDFKSNYVKNMVQTPEGRVSYAISAAVAALVGSAWFIALGLCATVAVLCALGQPFALPSVGEGAAWFAQTALVTWAYCLIALLLVFLSKSEVAGLVAAIALGFGWVDTMAASILLNTPGVPMALRDGTSLFLAADVATLGQGLPCDLAPCAFAAALVVLVGGACVLVMRRRSLA